MGRGCLRFPSPMRLLAAYFGILVFHGGGRLRFPEMAVKASNFHGGNGLPFRLGCMSWLQRGIVRFRTIERRETYYVSDFAFFLLVYLPESTIF